MSLKTKLLSVIISVLVVVGSGMGLVIYRQNSQELTEHARGEIKNTIQYNFQLVNLYVGRVQDNITNLAHDPMMAEALTTKDPAILAHISGEMTTINETVSIIENIALQEVSGTHCITIAANAGAESTIGKDFSDRDYCKGILKTKETYLSSAYMSKVGNNPVLGLVVPVKNANGEMLGFMYGSISLRELRGYLLDLQDDSSVVLLDRYGTPFLDTKTEIQKLDNRPTALVSEIQRRLAGHEKEGYFNNESNLAGYSFNGMVTVVFEESIVQLLSLANALNVTVFLSIVIAISLMAIVIFIFVGSITKRISRLSKLTQQIAGGQFTITLAADDLNAKDETAVLARAFNEMASRLKESYAMLEDKVNARTSELQTKADELNKARAAMINIAEDAERDRKQSESLARDLEKFQKAVDNAWNQIVITDKDGVVIYGNKSVERITGYALEETLGKKAGKLWSFPMPKEYYEKMWDTMKTKKQVFNGEVQNRRKNGEIYYAEVSISPILDDRGDVLFFVGIERDITKEKEIDKAKTEFVSLASHQLRTPLSTVSWYAEMLLAGDAGVLNEEQKKFVNEVYRGNQRMTHLVNILLDVSRLELGTFVVEPELTDIALLAQNVVHEQKPQIEAKKLKLSERYVGHLPFLSADPKLLRMVFQNLLSNAVKYTPEEGVVSIDLRLIKRGESVDKQMAHEDSVIVVVSDTGYGIPIAQQDKIFTKLFRADNVRKKDSEGTGLGLYIVKTIVDHSGGNIWFESQENKGTTFYVMLPLAGMEKKEGVKTST